MKEAHSYANDKEIGLSRWAFGDDAWLERLFER
jgi:hypothetical protein